MTSPFGSARSLGQAIIGLAILIRPLLSVIEAIRLTLEMWCEMENAHIVK